MEDSDWIEQFSRDFEGTRIAHSEPTESAVGDSDDEDDFVDVDDSDYRQSDAEDEGDEDFANDPVHIPDNEEAEVAMEAERIVNQIDEQLTRPSKQTLTEGGEDGSTSDKGKKKKTKEKQPPRISLAEKQHEEAIRVLGYDPKVRKDAWRNCGLFPDADSDDDDDEEEEEMVSETNRPLSELTLSQKEKSLSKTMDLESAINVDPQRYAEIERTFQKIREEEERRLIEQKQKQVDRIYDTGHQCVLCWFGDNGEDPVEADDWNRLAALWMHNRSMTSRDERAMIVAAYYRTHIYEPMRRQGKVIGLLTPQMAADHFTLHFQDPKSRQLDILRSLEVLRRRIDNKVMKTNSVTGESVPDSEQIKNMDVVVKLQERVYRWDTDKMACGNITKWRVSQEKLQSVFSLHRQFKFSHAPTRTSFKQRKNRLR